jgi:hypothetical protein
MVGIARTTRGRLLLAVSVLTLWTATGAALAATAVPFQATIRERTTFVLCPLGTAPLTAVCFTAQGTGTATPPGGAATQTFSGWVKPDPSLSCPDRLSSRSTATIYTWAGNLNIAAQGSQCPPPVEEYGTWSAVGGTGLFAGATGGGTYGTTDVVVNLDGTISSTTAYTGTLTLGP